MCIDAKVGLQAENGSKLYFIYLFMQYRRGPEAFFALKMPSKLTEDMKMVRHDSRASRSLQMQTRMIRINVYCVCILT